MIEIEIKRDTQFEFIWKASDRFRYLRLISAFLYMNLKHMVIGSNAQFDTYTRTHMHTRTKRLRAHVQPNLNWNNFYSFCIDVIQYLRHDNLVTLLNKWLEYPPSHQKPIRTLFSRIFFLKWKTW